MSALGPILLVCGIICGMIGKERTGQFWPYFLGGVIFPPAGIIFALRAKPAPPGPR